METKLTTKPVAKKHQSRLHELGLKPRQITKTRCSLGFLEVHLVSRGTFMVEPGVKRTFRSHDYCNRSSSQRERGRSPSSQPFCRKPSSKCLILQRPLISNRWSTFIGWKTKWNFTGQCSSSTADKREGETRWILSRQHKRLQTL